jgi:hypothetical protein
MPTQTRSSGRFSRSSAPHSRRPSARAGGGPDSSRARRTGHARGVPSMRRRRSAPQSGPQKAINALRGVIPGLAAGRSASRGGRAARKPLGFAVVAGVAGLAFSQRDKLARLRGGHDTSETPGADRAHSDGSYAGLAPAPASPPVPESRPPSAPPGA